MTGKYKTEKTKIIQQVDYNYIYDKFKKDKIPYFQISEYNSSDLDLKLFYTDFVSQNLPLKIKNGCEEWTFVKNIRRTENDEDALFSYLNYVFGAIPFFGDEP